MIEKDDYHEQALMSLRGPELQERGVKHDGDKVQLALLPVESLEEIGKVLDFGSKKYDNWNWAEGFRWSRLYSATLRHLFKHMRGEDKDSETGISHLAHAGANILFLIYHELHSIGEDDRYKRPTSSKEKQDEVSKSSSGSY